MNEKCVCVTRIPVYYYDFFFYLFQTLHSRQVNSESHAMSPVLMFHLNELFSLRLSTYEGPKVLDKVIVLQIKT